MTEKLFYTDSYIKEFSATVVSLTQVDDHFECILDKTAFFPTEAGQSCDLGRIDCANVLDVKEMDGTIVHVLDKKPVGDKVFCEIEWKKRFRNMQNHSGEHIVSGLIKSLYGFDNVGFHLGDDDVTLDFSGGLTREQLDGIEWLANRAVWENQEVRVSYPSSLELAELTYRSKLELTESVRIVSVGDVDTCACCAPHVAKTGEIGQIKLLDFMRYKGGIRLHILCGALALSDYGTRYFETLRLSHLLSVRQNELTDAVTQLLNKNEQMKQELKALRRERLVLRLKGLTKAAGNRVLVLSPEEKDLVREAVNLSVSLCDGVTVAIAGDDESGWRYAIGSEGVDLALASRAINAALIGRGGGSKMMLEGRFSASLASIESYFEATDFKAI